jgi:hypothetical protein
MILLTKAFFYDHFLVFSKKNMPTPALFLVTPKRPKTAPTSDLLTFIYTPQSQRDVNEAKCTSGSAGKRRAAAAHRHDTTR